MSLSDLPTLADRPRMACPKPASRLHEKTAEKKLTLVDEKQFKAEVWTREKSHCRCCGRKVIKTITRTAERGEVHHLHGRTGDLRFEVRAAILVCCACHEKLTGKVNVKLIAVASQTFTIRQGTFTDAAFPIQFTEAI